MKTMGAFISQVYRILDNNPGSTAGEIFAIYQDLYPETKRSRGEVAKRLSQLLDRGLVEKGHSRTCEFSGCEATTWNAECLYDEILSNEPAEETPTASCFGCKCENHGDCFPVDSDDEIEEEADIVAEDEEYDEETIYDDIENMSREEKAQRITDLCGETCQAVDPADAAFLRECRSALDQIDSNPMARLLLSSVPGISGKVTQLKKALRYF